MYLLELLSVKLTMCVKLTRSIINSVLIYINKNNITHVSSEE